MDANASLKPSDTSRMPVIFFNGPPIEALFLNRSVSHEALMASTIHQMLPVVKNTMPNSISETKMNST